MIRHLVSRTGVVPAIFLLTFGAILFAMAVIVALAGLFGAGVSYRELAVGVIIPVLFIPLLAYSTFPSLFQVYSAQATAQMLATTDPLTMTFNRKRFDELVESELARAGRYGEKFSVLLFDLDNFKGINDAYGFQIGDSVLRCVSEICQAQMRRSDVLARIGNNEFACLLPHTLEDGAIEFAERLRATVAETTLTVEKNQVEFTISVGVKTIEKETDLEDILRAAVRALHAAKERGKNRTVSASEELALEKNKLTE
jgi:diguanylate cyclase (GGDEF)-like protein